MNDSESVPVTSVFYQSEKDLLGMPADAAAVRRRRALRAALDAAGMSPAEAARAAGLKNANSIYNLYQGRSGSLSADTIERLAKVIPGATAGILQGEVEIPPSPFDLARSILVQVEVRAGVWRKTLEMPPGEQFEAPVPIQPGTRAAGAFGAVVRGAGAELLYPSEALLVCLPLDRFDRPLVSGNKVLLERVRDNALEVTVRDLVLRGGEAWLWPRTTDPESNQAVKMPWPARAMPWIDGEVRCRVAGVVSLACLPEL